MALVGRLGLEMVVGGDDDTPVADVTTAATAAATEAFLEGIVSLE